MKKKPVKSLALTKTALAAALSISRQALYTFLRKEGSPQRTRDGWDVGQVARFISRVANSESVLVATSDELRAAKLREIGLRCDLLALELRQRAGGYLDAADFEARLKRLGFEVRWAAWEHWVMQFPYDIVAHYKNECDDQIAARQKAKTRFDSYMAACRELESIIGPHDRTSTPTKPEPPPGDPQPPAPPATV